MTIWGNGISKKWLHPAHKGSEEVGYNIWQYVKYYRLPFVFTIMYGDVFKKRKEK